MAIRRKQIQQDVAHGGLNNQCFDANGIPMYKSKGGIDHCDTFETDPHLTFVKGATDQLNVCGTTNISDDLNVGCNTTICGTTDICGATCIDNTLDVSCATCLKSTLDVDGATKLNCTLDVCGATCIDDTLNVSCSTCICNTLTVDCDACFKEDVNIDCNTSICGTLDVNGISHLNNDVTISGDLYVCGTRHEEHTADLYVGSDLVTLRDGNNTALETGAKAGIIINNYDGTDSLGIVTDNTGTLRIGEYNTQKVYTTDDATFYSNKDLTIPITLPAGAVLHPLGQDDDIKIYYYVIKDETEPVATRSSAMCDGQLTCWNAAGCDIHTINAQPVGQGAILQCDTANNCHFYLENNGVGRVLEVNPDDNKLRWSCAATCNGQIPVFDGTKTTWTPNPTLSGQFLVWNKETKAYEHAPIGNNGEVLTSCVIEPEYQCGVPYAKEGSSWGTIDIITVNTSDNSIIPNEDIIAGKWSCILNTRWTPYTTDWANFNERKLMRPLANGQTAIYSLDNVHAEIDGYWVNQLSGSALCTIPTTCAEAIRADDKCNWYWTYCCSSVYRSTNKIQNGANLCWTCMPSNYVFNTMADYNAVAADIPECSRVTILCEENYTMSVDVQ